MFHLRSVKIIDKTLIDQSQSSVATDVDSDDICKNPVTSDTCNPSSRCHSGNPSSTPLNFFVFLCLLGCGLRSRLDCRRYEILQRRLNPHRLRRHSCPMRLQVSHVTRPFLVYLFLVELTKWTSF
jgi:hypothetical protein